MLEYLTESERAELAELEMLEYLSPSERVERVALEQLGLSLADFIARSPGREAPHHLDPLLELFERIAQGESVRAVVSTPPQHGKSETVLHALVWLLKRDAHKRHAYATYAQQFTRDQSQIARRVQQRSVLKAQVTQDRWRTPQGGSVIWTSRGGPLTGHPIDGVLIADDLLKGREEAHSQLARDTAWGWLTVDAASRLHPGASIIMIGTRWHLDDPIGRALEQGGWEPVKLPAIKGDGAALWPEKRPLEWLEERRSRLIAADWSALYMAEPIAEGAHVFSQSHYYDALPEGGYTEAHGFDAAYTAKTSGDYTVCLSGRKYGEKIYLTDMLRVQAEPRQYIPLLLARGVKRVTWYRSGTERGLEELLEREGIGVDARMASADKLGRAVNAATAWNRGDILIPRALWTTALEAELSQFTGQKDAHDDVVDALAGLCAALMRGQTSDDTARALTGW